MMKAPPPFPTPTADGRAPDTRSIIGILLKPDRIEDWLDSIGITVGGFTDEMMGSWVFGYVSALSAVHVRSVIVCTSGRVKSVQRHVHQPTGARILILPTTRVYQLLRRLSERLRSQPGRPSLRRCRSLCLAALGSVASHTSAPPWLVFRELWAEQCRVLLCQDYEHPRFDVASIVGWIRGVPVFATSQEDWRASAWWNPLRRPAFAAARGVVTASWDEAQRVQERYGLPASAVARIFDPIDLGVWRPGDRRSARTELGIPATARVVAWHGGIELHKKGLDILMDAWGRICQARPEVDLRLIMIGTGTDSAEVRNRIRMAGLRGVMWTDAWVADREWIRLRLSAADVYAFPSRHEAFPLSPLEALACGIPVVASDAMGIPDMLKADGQTVGRVVPCQDPEAFTKALGSLLDNHEECLILGRNARRHTELCFGFDAIGAQLRAFMLPE